MSVVPVSKDLHVAQETTVSIPTKLDSTNNVQRKKNCNWSEYDWVCRHAKKKAFPKKLIFMMCIYLEFFQVVCYSLALVVANFFVLTCLCMISLVQMIAWKDELRNLTNSTTVIQYEPTLNFLVESLLITYLIILILFVVIIGLDTVIKLLRAITLKMWIFMACPIIIIIVIVSYMNIPTPRLDISVNKICKKMVFNTDINGNPILTLPQDGYLPPGICYSHLCMVFVTILCNIQHIIIIFLIAKIRPKDSSNSSSRSSTAQTQKISKEVSKPKIVS